MSSGAEDLQRSLKEVAGLVDEVTGLIESAIIVGDLREAYRTPIHSRLSKCVKVLDILVQEEVGVGGGRPSDLAVQALSINGSAPSLGVGNAQPVMEPAYGPIKQKGCKPGTSQSLWSKGQQPLLRCIRCGTQPLWGGAACSGWIKEAGAPCTAFNVPEGQEQLGYYRSQYHWKCPRDTCGFTIPRSGLTHREQIQGVIAHEQRCTHPPVVRSRLPI